MGGGAMAPCPPGSDSPVSMLSQVKFLDFAWRFFKSFFQNRRCFLTQSRWNRGAGPGGGAIAPTPSQILTVPETKAFPSKCLLFLYAPPPPRFFGPTDGTDSNNTDFYNFWQDVKLLVFSSKSPKQSHSILF